MRQRQFAIKYAKDNNIELNNMDIYEFGIWVGHSLVEIRKHMIEYGVTCGNMYCFDSFTGLPHYEKGTPCGWKKGSYSAVNEFGVSTVQQAIQALKEKISFSHVPTHFISGFFKDSLNKELLNKYDFKPAFYIDIDVDLYSSTIECLDFMFSNNLVQSGTLIGYDDWGGTEEYKGGESKAHVEIMAKYNIASEQIHTDGEARPCIRKVFIIK